MLSLTPCFPPQVGGQLVTVTETFGEAPNGTAWAVTTQPAPELDPTNIVVGKVVEVSAVRLGGVGDGDDGVDKVVEVSVKAWGLGEDGGG